MMHDRKVTITIAEDGSTEIEVDGVKGPACKALTADMEEALGTVSKCKEKADMTAVVSKTETQHKINSQ
jgi:hypothetical protein